MAFSVGTSTDWKDLLNDLVTFVTANGWTLEKTVTVNTEVEERYLRGPGSAVDSQVYVNIRTGAVVSDAAYWWEVRGAVGFDTNLTFDNQPGTSPDTYLLLRNASIDYWFAVSDRRIVVVAQVNTSYFSMYAGFFLPFATPIEYPFPLYVAASKGPPPLIFTTTNSGIRSVADPGIRAAYLREGGGQWQQVYNHDDALTADDDFQSHQNIGYYTWPYFAGGGAQSTPSSNFPLIDIRPPPADTTANIIVPVHLHGSGFDQGVVGFLEEIYWIPGFGVGAEQTFTLSLQRASGTLTTTANFANSDTITIGTRTYTFQTTLTDVNGNVLLGATQLASLENLRDAINLGLGAGIDYAASTTLHPTVFAGNPTATAIEVFARSPGAGGNSIATTETSAVASWGAATLGGGGTSNTYTIFPNVLRNNRNHFFALNNV